MRHLALGFVVIVTMAGLPSGEAAAQEASPPGRSLSDIFDDYQLHVGLNSAGPLLFRDAPDAMLEELAVFQYGGTLAFLFGNEMADLHRLGIGLGYDLVARSASRDLAFFSPYLAYEIGHPLILQLGLGANVGLGTEGFAEHYKGFYSAAALRYSFRRGHHSSPVSVSLGLSGKFIAATEDLEYSSAFVGAQVELIYHSK